MFKRLPRERSSELGQSIALIVLFIVLILLLCLFSYLLFSCTVADSYADALSSFVIGRVKAQPWLLGEVRAVRWFVGIVVFLGITVLVVMRPIASWWRNWRAERLVQRRFSSEYGTAFWGTARDLRKLLGRDGLVVGYQPPYRPVRLSMRASCEHIAVIGPTGCGKTTSYFVPNLLMLPDNTSAVVTDPKGEIESIVGPILRKRGWETFVLSLTGPSSTFNPLLLARDETEISEVADITLRNGYSSSGISGDMQWINFTQPLWESALLMEVGLREDDDDMNLSPPSIQGAYKIITSRTEEQRAELAKMIGGSALERYLAYAQSIKSPETAASIKTVLTSSIKLFMRPDIVNVTQGGNTFKPVLLRERPVVFFVQIPERKASLLKPLSATMFWQLLEHIIDVPGLPIVFMLDEFPNIGQIPSFAQMAATVRSRKISISIGLQGVEQLSREYSREEQQDILNNMKSKIYYPGLAGDSGSYASSLAGMSTVDIHSQWQRRELMSSDELRRVPDGKVVLLAHNLNPVMLDAVPYFREPLLSVMTGQPANLAVRSYYRARKIFKGGV